MEINLAALRTLLPSSVFDLSHHSHIGPTTLKYSGDLRTAVMD